MAGDLIRLAREARGLSAAALSRKAGVSGAQISRFERGAPVPKDEVEAIAGALEFPPSFFVADWTLGGSTGAVHFRKKSSALVGPRRRAIALLNLAAFLYREVGDRPGAVDSPTRSLVAVSTDDPPAIVDLAAHRMRAQWAVPPGPIQHLTQLCESAGIGVFLIDLGAEFSGVSMWPLDGQPVVLLNSQMPGDRRRWTLAHELAHLHLHAEVRTSDDMEAEADAFASELLMPAREIRGQLRSLSVRRLRELKLEWGVSMQALVMRAGALGMISDYEKRGYFVSFSKKGWRKAEPDRLPGETTALIPELVRRATEHLGDRDALARAINMPADLLNTLVAFTGDRNAPHLRFLSGGPSQVDSAARLSRLDRDPAAEEC